MKYFTLFLIAGLFFLAPTVQAQDESSVDRQKLVPYEEMTTMRKNSKVRRGVSNLSKRRGDVSKGDTVMVQQWTPSDRVKIKIGELEG